MKILLLTIILLSLSACTGRMALLKNDKGDVKTCETSAGDEMLTGAFISGIHHRQCIEAWEKAGYKEVK